MCTAVVGGSIHRAATRISAASDQTSTTPITSHRTKDRRKPLRNGVLGCVSRFSVTFQNTSLGSVVAYGRSFARIRSAALCSVHSCQKPRWSWITLSHHAEPSRLKDKVGLVPRCRLVPSNRSGCWDMFRTSQDTPGPSAPAETRPCSEKTSACITRNSDDRGLKRNP